VLDLEDFQYQPEACQGCFVLIVRFPALLHLPVVGRAADELICIISQYREGTNQDLVLFLQMPGDASCSRSNEDVVGGFQFAA
jgi:hypothetical protein